MLIRKLPDGVAVNIGESGARITDTAEIRAPDRISRRHVCQLVADDGQIHVDFSPAVSGRLSNRPNYAITHGLSGGVRIKKLHLRSPPVV